MNKFNVWFSMSSAVMCVFASCGKRMKDSQPPIKLLKPVTLQAQQKTPDPLEIKDRKVSLRKREMHELLTQSIHCAEMCQAGGERVREGTEVCCRVLQQQSKKPPEANLI